MILWTIQPKKIVELLEGTGRFACDGRRADRDFRQAYHWMSEQMVKRGIQQKPKCPVWAWYRFNCSGNNKRGPRLAECKETCPLNKPFCRIKLNVPDKLVLLSDFDLWHCVLNRHFIGTAKEEKTAIKDSWRRMNASDPNWEFADYIRNSWEKIFDLDLKAFKSKVPEFALGKLITIQACIPYIMKEWVLQIDHFVATQRSNYYIRKWGILNGEPGFGRGQTK